MYVCMYVYVYKCMYIFSYVVDYWLFNFKKILPSF